MTDDPEVIQRGLRKIRRAKRAIAGSFIAVIGTRGFPSVQGGVETHCHELYREIAQLGIEVLVYARSRYVGLDPYSHNGVAVIPLWSLPSVRFEALSHTLWAVILAACLWPRPLLHIHGIGPALLLPVARALGLRAVVTHHGRDDERARWGTGMRMLLRAGEWCAAAFAEQIICVSQSETESLRVRRKRKATYIPNGVGEWPRLPVGNVLKSLSVRPQEYLLAVGRWVPEKGFHLLLDAFRSLKTDFNLVLVGSSRFATRYSQDLRALAVLDPRVRIAGERSRLELAELYTYTAALVVPSFHEGLSIVLLEGLSYRIPLVCSDIEANRELVKNPACLFSSGNTEQLRARLEGIVNGATRISPEWRPEGFQWHRIAEQTISIYKACRR